MNYSTPVTSSSARPVVPDPEACKDKALDETIHQQIINEFGEFGKCGGNNSILITAIKFGNNNQVNLQPPINVCRSNPRQR